MRGAVLVALVCGLLLGGAHTIPVSGRGGCLEACCDRDVNNGVCGNDCTLCELPGSGEAPCAPEPCGSYCYDPCADGEA